jgi:hypothetical protein
MAYLTDFTPTPTRLLPTPGRASNGNPKGYAINIWSGNHSMAALDRVQPARTGHSQPPDYHLTPGRRLSRQRPRFPRQRASVPRQRRPTFTPFQWRIGEIAAPGVSGYTPGKPRKYEVEEVWTSPALTTFTASIRVPLAYAEPGHTYRARVRHKDH